MNWFEVIKNQRTITDTVTHVGTKTEDVPEKDEGRCYQKLLAIRDNLLHMMKPENNDLFRDYAEDMRTTETGWVPERNKEGDKGDNIYYSTEDTGPLEEYSRKGKNFATKDGVKLYRWVEDEDKKEPPRFAIEEDDDDDILFTTWGLEPPSSLIQGLAIAKVGEGFREEEYCVALEKVQEFFNSGKEFVGIGSNKFTVNGKEFSVVAQNKYNDKKRQRMQHITIRLDPRYNSGETVIASYRFVLTWEQLEKRIRMTPRQRPRFVYWVWVRRPYWWAKEIFDKIESASGEIGKWWN